MILLRLCLLSLGSAAFIRAWFLSKDVGDEPVGLCVVYMDGPWGAQNHPGILTRLGGLDYGLPEEPKSHPGIAPGFEFSWNKLRDENLA